MADQWQSAKKHTKADVKVFSIFGNIKKYKNLDLELLNHSPRRPSRNFREGIKGGDSVYENVYFWNYWNAQSG